jgi:hypothetical protein
MTPRQKRDESRALACTCDDDSSVVSTAARLPDSARTPYRAPAVGLIERRERLCRELRATDETLAERRRILEALVDIDRRLRAHEGPPLALAHPPRRAVQHARRRIALAGRVLALGALAQSVMLMLVALGIVALTADFAPSWHATTATAANAFGPPSDASTSHDAGRLRAPAESRLASALRMHALFDGARPLALEPGDLEDPLVHRARDVEEPASWGCTPDGEPHASGRSAP